jgi:hypothetical protein
MGDSDLISYDQLWPRGIKSVDALIPCFEPGVHFLHEARLASGTATSSMLLGRGWQWCPQTPTAADLASTAACQLLPHNHPGPARPLHTCTQRTVMYLSIIVYQSSD